MISMELETILSELKRRFGFDNILPDSNKIYSLEINSKYVLNLANAPNSADFYLYSDILTLNQDNQLKLRIYERLLGANLFGKETHGSFFAFDSTRSTVLLIKRFDSKQVDYSTFYDEFREFINGLGYWEKVMEEKKHSASNETKTSSFVDPRTRA